MRCPNCGQRLTDTAVRCPACEIIIADWLAEHPGQQAAAEDDGEYRGQETFETEEGQAWGAREEQYGDSQEEAYADPYKPEVPIDMPMKWHWFLVHISLVFSSFSDFWNGWSCLMGTNYGTRESADYIYNTYPAMKQVDMIYAFFMLAMGIFTLYVRRELATYRKKGPFHLMLLYALNGLILAGYTTGATLASGQNLWSGYVVASIIISVVMILVNKIYYDKRRHLFTR